MPSFIYLFSGLGISSSIKTTLVTYKIKKKKKSKDCKVSKPINWDDLSHYTKIQGFKIWPRFRRHRQDFWDFCNRNMTTNYSRIRPHLFEISQISKNGMKQWLQPKTLLKSTHFFSNIEWHISPIFTLSFPKIRAINKIKTRHTDTGLTFLKSSSCNMTEQTLKLLRSKIKWYFEEWRTTSKFHAMHV